MFAGVERRGMVKVSRGECEGKDNIEHDGMKRNGDGDDEDGKSEKDGCLEDKRKCEDVVKITKV